MHELCTGENAPSVLAGKFKTVQNSIITNNISFEQHNCILLNSRWDIAVCMCIRRAPKKTKTQYSVFYENEIYCMDFIEIKKD